MLYILGFLEGFTKINFGRQEFAAKDNVKGSVVSWLVSLMYAMVCTRLDIAQAMGVVSRYMSYPGQEHWRANK